MFPPAHIRLLLRLYAALILVFTAFRLLLLLVVRAHWGSSEVPLGYIAHAFFIGWRFDTVIACYLLVLPFMLLSIAHLSGARKLWPTNAVQAFLGIVLLPCMLILSADIPWFLQFYSRLNAGALQWTDDGAYMYKMVVQERGFLVYLLPVVIAYLLALRMIRRATRTYRYCMARSEKPPAHRVFGAIAVFVVGGGLLFLGMRGRTDEKSPIQAGTAYFCDDPFLNQLGLNPIFTFGASVAEKFASPHVHMRLANQEEAIRSAAASLGAHSSVAASPIARSRIPEVPMDSANVVVIILESLSTFKLGEYGGPQGLMPFLTELKHRSLSFDNAYSAGIHTYNGIWSTLYSFPALYDQQPLQDWLDRRQTGLGNVLRDHGYSTVFFTTHDPEFDNMKGSLLAHGFDRIVSEDDYPEDQIASTNGVPDHRMFQYAVPVLSSMAKKGPFLSVFMTTSDHKPFIIPTDLHFTPHSTDIQDRIVEYVDRSLEEFFVLASKEPWYNNTVFVLLGDHGINMGHTYDMPLSFHHVPLIFHSPSGIIAPGHVRMPTGQIDVAPTILGALHVPWTNTTLGIDALNERRPFMYFCADDRIGCLDSIHYFIHRANGQETLFNYTHLSFEDLKERFPEKTRTMKEYADGMMQTTQWLVDHDMLDGGTKRSTP